MTRCIEALPRGDFSPLFTRAPFWGTPLFPKYGPGLQSWEALRAGWVMIGRKWSALCAVLESGLKSAAWGTRAPRL